MELKPGYKQTEVGAIPEDWDTKPLGSIALVAAGGTPRREVASYWNGDIPWITTTEVNSREIKESAQSITDSGLSNSAAKLFAPGTLLLALYGQGKTRGKVGVLGIEAATNQACAGIVVANSVSSTFVFYFLAKQYYFIRGLSNSGSQENLSSEIVKSLQVPLPSSLAEQVAIAEALTDADTLIDSLSQLITKKRQIKQGAMQELLTGERRLPGFSGAWDVKHFAELFTFSGGFSASRDQLSQSGYCYLHYGDIHTSNKTSVDVNEDFSSIPKLNIGLADVSSSSLLKDGDVVFVDASEDDEGTSKHVIVVNPNSVPFIAGLHTIVAKRKLDVFDNQYLRFCFQTAAIKKQFRFYAVGTKVSGISKSNIGKISMPIPTQLEQSAIAEILTGIDSELANLEDRLEKARQVKMGMMQELLTGRIRLLTPKSNVIQFPSPQPKPLSQKGHSDAMNDAVIISVLAHRYGTEQYPLGRFRYTKLSYLLHRYAEHEAAGYFKKAAGPYKPATKYQGGEKIAQKNDYVREHQSSGGFKGFVASENIAQAEKYFNDWYGADVLTWLDRFKYKKKDELELLATVDMAMEDVRKTGGTVSVTTVKQVLQSAPEWVPKLDRAVFSDENIGKAIAELQRVFQP